MSSASLRQGTNNDLQRDYFVVTVGGFSSTERITDVSRDAFKMADLTGAVALGRFKGNSRMLYMLYGSHQDAIAAMDRFHLTTRRANDGTKVDIITAYGGSASTYLRGSDSLLVGKGVRDLAFLERFAGPDVSASTTFSSFDRPVEPEIATNLAPFRLSPVQGSPFIPQEHSNIHLNSSGSNGLAPPRNPFDPIEGSHIPTVNVPMTAEEASTLIMPKKIYSQPVRAADGGTVWVTRNPFFERFDQDSDQDRRLFYIFDVQANKLPDSDTELIGRVEKALGIGPGVIKEIQTWRAYRAPSNTPVQRYNLKIGFGDQGETRAVIVLKDRDWQQRIMELFRNPSRNVVTPQASTDCRPTAPAAESAGQKRAGPVDQGWAGFHKLHRREGPR